MAQIYNIRSLENLPFDIAFRLAVRPNSLGALPLAAGMPGQPNWTDLRIDCAKTRSGLAGLGHRIPAPRTRFCHWSVYLRPGLFPLYRRLLNPDDPISLRELPAIGADKSRRSRGEEVSQLSPL